MGTKHRCLNFTENIKLALRSIQSNVLRAALTFTIIGLGLMALVGILTAIDGFRFSVEQSFASLGANTFTVENDGGIRMGRRDKRNPIITYYEGMAFKKRFNFPAKVSLNTVATGVATVEFLEEKTNPNVQLKAIDENYLAIFGHNLRYGRAFSIPEITSGVNYAILGSDVATRIAGTVQVDSIVGQLISVNEKKFRVIGILEAKGNTNVSSDNFVAIPLQAARMYYNDPNDSYTLNVQVDDINQLELGIDEATGVFRSVRKLHVSQDNDFEVSKSDRLAGEVLQQMMAIGFAAFFIGIITLFGAGIGLMNIMLVSVNERTREIGLSKALGAKRSTIIIQFLTESVVICQIGGIMGMILGIAAGNLVAMQFDIGFIMPWMWLIGGFIFCFIIGVSAGVYPALVAGRLNPVEALRYE